MNIFVINEDPTVCAKYLDNKRVVKMTLETAQLLSTAIWICGGEGPYKKTHENHPCSIWVRKARGNYIWLLSYFKALGEEYTRRYKKVHKSIEVCYEILDKNKDLIPVGDRTDFCNCTTFKDIKDTFEAYKLELNKKWENDKVPPKFE